jgi:hypothetical protein
MYKYISKTSNYKSDKCKIACKQCRVCKKDTREYDDCWSACDMCNRCNADSHNAKIFNDPYVYRPWFLSKDNHSFETVPITKQYCDNLCGPVMCKKYNEQMFNYTQCLRCQEQRKCWSPYQQKCIDCGYDRSIVSCEKKYGCNNPDGPQFAKVPPINPMYNNCTVCWDQSSYLT